jgi:hypothetical protein
MSEAGYAGSASPVMVARKSGVARELSDNPVFYLIFGTWFAYTLADSIWRQNGFVPELVEYAGRATRSAVLLACITLALAGTKVLLTRPERPMWALAGSLRGLLPGNAIVRCAYSLVVLTIFMASFLHSKMLIPVLSPFDWDATFSAWDQAVFGGYHPWQLLQPWFSYPLLTRVLDYAYVAWVPGVFVFWCWIYTSPKVPGRLRRQYWIATLLSWILLGIVLATLLSSVGPCFLPQLFPDQAAPYAPLNAYLADLHHRYPLSSGLTKEHLLEVWAGNGMEPGGISAMPSMHNAQAMLFVLAAYRISRGFGHVMLAYAAVIFIASILLAWHYAVDGIIGIIGTLAIWRISGWASGGPESQPR